MSLNRIVVDGRLAADPELRDVNDTTVCAFRIAHNRYHKGEKLTDWFSISVWGRQGEICQEHLSKGSVVVVDGEFMPREYETKDNEKRLSLDIRASSVTFAGGTREQAESDEDEKDEIPF